MAEYQNDGEYQARKRGFGAGTTIGLVVLAIVVLVGILFATGFWSADVKEGALPTVDVSAKGGEMPAVDVDSKELVVGTTEATVDVPKVETEKKKVDVPVVGVKE